MVRTRGSNRMSAADFVVPVGHAYNHRLKNVKLESVRRKEGGGRAAGRQRLRRCLVVVVENKKTSAREGRE